jgi:hypothetical protein
MKYIDLKVIGNTTEIKEFLDLCSKIEYLGIVGSHRDIKVSVDGDGSGRLFFKVVEEGKELDLPIPEFKNLDEREKFVSTLEVSIGE